MKRLYLKLLQLLHTESLARSRKRIKRNLRESATVLIYRNIFRDGMSGNERDRNIYNV